MMEQGCFLKNAVFKCVRCGRPVSIGDAIRFYFRGGLAVAFWICGDCLRKMQSVSRLRANMGLCRLCAAAFIHELVLWAFGVDCAQLHEHQAGAVGNGSL